MGHKVHPTGIRLGIAKDWNSKWYAGKKEYAEYLAADLMVREMLRKRLAQAGISKILIERPAKTARVTIHTARPGVVIGKRGEDIEKLRKEVSDLMGVPAHINVTEVRKPELDAQLVAESIAQQLERRIMFRRAMKRAVGNAMRLGALGIKVNVAGRLNGADYTTSTGMKVNLDAQNKALTRLGLAFGKSYDKSSLYGRFSYYHDFGSGVDLTAASDGASVGYSEDMARNWTELTIGGSAKLGKNANAYAEVSKYMGQITSNVRYNIGARWSF